MAPEQIDTKLGESRRATDVYALGTILFELLSKEAPFENASYIELFEKLLKEGPPKLRDRLPNVDRDLAAICDKARELAPEDRYETVSAFADDLRRYQESKPVLAKAPNLWHHLQRWIAFPNRIPQAGICAMTFGSFSALWIVVINVAWSCLPYEPSHADLCEAS